MPDYFEEKAKEYIVNEINKNPKACDMELLHIINNATPFIENNLPKVKYTAWLNAKRKIILELINQGKIKKELNPFLTPPKNTNKLF